MSIFEEQFKKAFTLHQSAKFDQAKSVYLDLIKKQPNNKDLILLLGTLYLQVKNLIKSEDLFQKYLSLDKENYLVFQNLGVLHIAKKEYKKAIKYLDKSLNLNPKNHHIFFYLSQSFYELGQNENAYEALKNYLKRTNDNPEAFLNMGNICFSLNKIDESIYYFDKSLELNSNYHESLANKALALSKIPNYSESINFYKRAISINDCELYRMNYANLLRHLGMYSESIDQLKNALSINPKNIDLFFSLQNSYQSANNFSNIELVKLKKIIINYKDGFDPFNLLYLFDDLDLQLKNAEKFSQKQFKNINVQKKFYQIKNDKKIRIVYVSADFRKHPVARLIQNLIKKHNRDIFDVCAISLKKSEDILYKEFQNDFDDFFDASKLSDNEILAYSRKKNFHIAIDLGGYTRFARTNLFALRLAPIQISYLGFLGTMGTDFIDYIISDINIIPFDLQKYYKEKIIYLPFFQPNSKLLNMNLKKFNKKEFGLPENKFIFCCFNNSFKINKNIVDAWIKILNQVPDSVFLCYIKNDFQKTNILDYLAKNKINHKRIIFSKKLSYQLYLGQLSLCDLFLDTYPYNGGATVQDALISGLPVVTLVGETYPSRMCSSILKTAKLSELCTYSFSEYINKATSLAQDSQKLHNFKKLLSTVYNHSNLNISKFIKYYEDGLVKAFNNHKNNKQIDHIMINGEI